MVDPKSPLQKSHGRKTIRPTLKPRELMEQTPDLARVWKAQVITLLPEAFPGILGQSLTGRALKDGLWQLDIVALRQFGEGASTAMSMTPWHGGGAGMVLRPDIMASAIDYARPRIASDAPLVYLSPRGRPFTQDMAKSLAAGPGVTMICEPVSKGSTSG